MNEFIFKNKFVSLDEVIQKTSKQMVDFQEAQRLGQANLADSISHQRRELKKQDKLKEHWLKANWDIAVDAKAKIIGLGVCIHDFEGEIQVSTSCNQ